MRDNGAWPPFAYTHDLELADGGPRRANVLDLGGEEHVDLDPQPEIGVEPTGCVVNEQNRHIAGLERVNALCRLWVEFSGSTPIIVKAAAMGTRVEISTFTVNHPSTGVVEIFWTIGALAPMEAAPEVAATSKLAFFGVQHTSPPSGKAGISVTGWATDTGTLTDGSFVVAIN